MIGEPRDLSYTNSISYRVAYVPGDLTALAHCLAESLIGRSALIVTTPTVAHLYGHRLKKLMQEEKSLDVSMITVSCSEAKKTLHQVEEICSAAVDISLGRASFLVSLGGGVCSDLTTVAASLIRRGLRHLRVPTTLIGQVDAGVGVKGAVNFMGQKSYLGCFHPPTEVLLWPQFLCTLREDQIRDGIAEIAKMAIVSDRKLFKLMEEQCTLLDCPEFYASETGQEISRRAISAMLDQLSENLYEDRSKRRLVDFGHTFSPLIEADSGFTLSHGHAVSLDMSLSTSLARALGMISHESWRRILTLLSSIGLPLYAPEITIDLFWRSLKHAELHRDGNVNLVLPSDSTVATFVESSHELTAVNINDLIHELREAQIRK